MSQEQKINYKEMKQKGEAIELQARYWKAQFELNIDL